MKDSKFRYFVTRVNSSDEYDDSVNACAIRIRPSAILRLAYASLIAWIAREALGWSRFYHLAVAFREIDWLDWKPPEDNRLADMPEEWEEGAVTETIKAEWVADNGFCCYTAQIAGGNSIWFTCYNKYSTEFASWEVDLRDLLKAIRREDVAVELREWFSETRLGRALAGGAA